MKNYNCTLLVDDDPIANFISHEILSKNKICKEICISRNGEEALTFLHEYQLKNHCLPDVILVDIQMPIMDGIEFLHEYNKLSFPGKEKTRVIMLSNVFSRSDVGTLRKMDHSYFLNKPLAKENLFELLDLKEGLPLGMN